MFVYPTRNLPMVIHTLGKVDLLPNGQFCLPLDEKRSLPLNKQCDLPLDKQHNLPIISMQQIHSDHFQVVASPNPQVLLNTDAILTELASIQLEVKTADCLPIMIYHPKPLIGVVHAGRKGTEQQILKKVLRFIQSNYKLDGQLQIFFGPCIYVNCYQIDRETDEHYDLIQRNSDQVRAIFSPNQAKIIYSNQCTAHQNDQYFSFRNEGNGVQMNLSRIILVTND